MSPNPPAQPMQALWNDPNVAARYANAENATRPFAQLLVQKSGLAARSEPARIFDLGTGTGAAVQEIYDAVPRERWEGVSVLGGDVSEGMLEYLKARGEKAGWKGLETRVIDGNNLADLLSSTDRFTHSLCTFAIFLLPDALPNLHKLSLPGAFVGISTWTHLPWHTILDRSVSLMPTPRPSCPTAAQLMAKFTSGRNWESEEYVASQLREAGFVNVATEVKRETARVGSPAVFMESMQFPLKIVRGFWDDDGVGEEKKDEWMKVLNEIMYKEIVDMVGGEDKGVEMDFEAVVAWGWKGE